MIIVIDLDDTLLNSDIKISEYNKEILTKMQNLGHKIMISTLRSLKRTKNFAKELNADYVSCFLGNLCLTRDGKIVRNNPLNIQNFSNIISDFKQVYNGWIGFETEKQSVIANKEVANKYDGVEFIKEEKVLDILNTNNIYKISFSCINDEEIIGKFKQLAEKYNCSYKFSKGYRYCDLIPKNTDKINAIRVVKQYNKNEKIIVFGDDSSDIESIKYADIGVAMENALIEVKDIADYITLSNNDNGVGVFLNNL